MMSAVTGTGKESTGGRKPQEPAVKCPRCDSPNTKFCYYNNYSLSQPRHFCKTCRRYWTKGGALRNVPIGGGSRKNKRSKHSSSGAADPLKFFQGLSPAMDFQLGAINNINSPRFSNNTVDDVVFNHLSSSFGPPAANNCFNLESSSSSPPLTFPLSSHHRNGALGFHHQEMGSCVNAIESLSSMNQDLHWKLQQQRLASTLLGQENTPFHVQKPQPILFHNLDIISGNGINGTSSELFFAAPPTSANWNQAWSTELTHFTSMP